MKNTRLLITILFSVALITGGCSARTKYFQWITSEDILINQAGYPTFSKIVHHSDINCYANSQSLVALLYGDIVTGICQWYKY